MIFDQSEFDLRCEWGEQGVISLAPISDVIIVVDVISFSTSVEIATNNGAMIFPYQWRDKSAINYAKKFKAELASRERQPRQGYSLSPSSLVNISAETRLVLPSPNGSTLSLKTGSTLTLAGCLRNAKAIANFAQNHGKKIAVIPAGERWLDGSIRFAVEDLIGAGAILSNLQGKLSPEAETAVMTFKSFQDKILTIFKNCSSGKELIDRKCFTDVELAAKLNQSSCVPVLRNNFYIKAD